MKHPPTEQIYAGKIVREAIQHGIELCKSDITGTQLDSYLEEFIRDHRCVPALKGYRPPFTDRTYQHTICLSRNNEAVHGVPQDVPLSKEDLITIDLVVSYKGWHADSARTFTHSTNLGKMGMVKNITGIHTNALSIITPQMLFDNYGSYCNKIAHQIFNVGLIKEFCGHGIGRHIHEDPQIPCYPCGSMAVFEVGRSYAVEPVIAAKKDYTLYHGTDGWVALADCLTAHMEDTIFISDVGIMKLT